MEKEYEINDIRGVEAILDDERGMPTFYNDWENYDDDLSLEVKYPKDW